MSDGTNGINRRRLLEQSAIEHRAVLGGVVTTSVRSSVTEFDTGETVYVDVSGDTTRVYEGVCVRDPHEIGEVDHCAAGTVDHGCHVPATGKYVYVVWNTDRYPNGYVPMTSLSDTPADCE